MPDEIPAVRAALWKIVLGYLPVDVFIWDSSLTRSRELYKGFTEDLLSAKQERLGLIGSERQKRRDPALQRNQQSADCVRCRRRGASAASSALKRRATFAHTHFNPLVFTMPLEASAQQDFRKKNLRFIVSHVLVEFFSSEHF